VELGLVQSITLPNLISGQAYYLTVVSLSGDGVSPVGATVLSALPESDPVFLPLFSTATTRQPDSVVETSTAKITYIADRVRDRHAREANFQKYDHYLTFYWEQRVASIEIIDRVAKGGAAAEKFQRLLDLISFNFGYTCFQAIRTAKAALSETTDTFIDIPEINLKLPFSRMQFESLLAEPLATLRQLIDQVLDQAGLQPRDVDMVVRTGGTSQIVAVRQLLEELFEGRVVAHDPFTSVAAGLAIASYHGWRYEP
jgi:hypothetical protein